MVNSGSEVEHSRHEARSAAKTTATGPINDECPSAGRKAGFLQLAQPIKNLFEWDLPFLAVPVLLLIAIPAYQHFILEDRAGWHASSKPGGDEGLAEGLTEGMAEEPDKPPDVTAL